MFLKATALFASAHLGATRVLPKGGPQKDGDTRGPALVHRWAEVARQSAEWWFHRDHLKAPDGQTAAALRQSVPPDDQMDEFLDLGAPPLGESPYDCNMTLSLAPGSLALCSSQQLLEYSWIHGMHAEFKLHPFMDQAVYTGSDPARSLAPCKDHRNMSTDWNHSASNMFEVVIDPQFSNEPYCCPVEYLPNGADAAIFEALSYYRPVPGSNIGYSVLEPEKVPCSKSDPCPVVVELPGDGQAPWLLLQAWCYTCSLSLRSVVVSVSDVPSEAADVEAQLIPAVMAFLRSRDDIDDQRVYLVSTGSGSEAGLLALLKHPDTFAFGLFAGKFRVTRDIELAAASVTQQWNSKLRKISFHVGSSDTAHNEEQNFWKRITDVVKPISLPMQVELRYYPGGTNAMWYAAWNAYHDLLWTGKKGIEDYLQSVALTCAPTASGVPERYSDKLKNIWQNEQDEQVVLDTLSP